jgi:hypothetical protein
MNDSKHETFANYLISEVKRLRKIFSDHNMPKLQLTIDASGRTDGEDIRIMFTIDSDYNTNAVTGDSIDACVDEFFRRNTWQKAHNYLALPNVTSE